MTSKKEADENMLDCLSYPRSNMNPHNTQYMRRYFFSRNKSRHKGKEVLIVLM
jgi:hypothetical protein